MKGSIICGVDGSNESRVALRVATQLSGQLGLRLVVAHVAPAAAFAPDDNSIPVPESGSRELLEQLALSEGIADLTICPLHGFPAERLADLGDEENAEFIVVGSRGRGAFKAALLGSVSRELIGVARCPVLVVPPGVVAA